VSHSKFPVQVLTPEGEVFSEEVEMVSTRTALGLIAILARHEPLLAILEPTELRLICGDLRLQRRVLLLQLLILGLELIVCALRDAGGEEDRCH